MPRRKIIQVFWAAAPGRWEEVWLTASLLSWVVTLVATVDLHRSHNFSAFLGATKDLHFMLPLEYLWTVIPGLLVILYLISIFRASPRLRQFFRVSLVFWNTFLFFILLLTGAGTLVTGSYFIQSVIASRLVLNHV